MIIDIPDNCKDKIKVAKILMVLYTFEKFDGNKTESAKFLGVVIRTLRNWVKTMPELSHFKNPANGIVRGNDDWKRYTDSEKWRTKTISDCIVDK
jgi:hypothetical protein